MSSSSHNLNRQILEINYTEVNTFAELPAPGDNTGEIIAILSTTGSLFLFNLKRAGFYLSNGSVWTRLGELQPFFTTDKFVLSDNADNTKKLLVDLTTLSTATTRTLFMPDGDLKFIPAVASLSDTTNQKPTVITPVEISFDTNDLLVGITHSETVNPEDIIVDQDGVYVVAAQPQVERTSGGGAETFHMWFRVNDVDIPNSNVELKLTGVGESDVIPLAMPLVLNAGDKINVMMSVSTATNGIGLVAATPVGEPAIPSIILLITKGTVNVIN